MTLTKKQIKRMHEDALDSLLDSRKSKPKTKTKKKKKKEIINHDYPELSQGVSKMKRVNKVIEQVLHNAEENDVILATPDSLEAMSYSKAFKKFPKALLPPEANTESKFKAYIQSGERLDNKQGIKLIGKKDFKKQDYIHGSKMSFEKTPRREPSLTRSKSRSRDQRGESPKKVYDLDSDNMKTPSPQKRGRNNTPKNLTPQKIEILNSKLKV